MQPAWVRHVTLTSYDTTKRGTHRTHKSQLQADTANQDRPTGLILQRLPRVIYHHLIVYVQPSWCFYSTLFLTQQGRSLKLAARAGFAIARSGFELFRLCHGYDVMGIRSCELSEPHCVWVAPTLYRNIQCNYDQAVHKNKLTLEPCLFWLTSSNFQVNSGQMADVKKLQVEMSMSIQLAQ